jgi:hypothetical protein
MTENPRYLVPAFTIATPLTCSPGGRKSPPERNASAE